MDAAPTQSMPETNHLAHIPAQTGEAANQEHIYTSVFHGIKKRQQAGSVKRQAAAYVTRGPHNHKASLMNT